MNRIAYTAFVAFCAVIATLWAVSVLVAENRETDDDRRLITQQELAANDSLESCWKAIDGKVYDVTEYIPRHPTSEDVMLEWCGRDATEGWYNKTPGRPHSARAASMLEQYLIGELADAPAPTAQPEEPAPAPDPAAHPQGRVLLGLSPGTYLDGRYRGMFSDRGAIQVNIQFDLRDHHFHNVRFRYLSYRDVDYLALEEHEELYAVMRQHRQIVEYLEGRPLSAMFDLYAPENVVDDIDGFTGATLRGNKLISAIRDALNRGVYQWP
nr:cytochrome b5-like heme/steroid binding domain-containing protein [Thioalkalivibrio denitrificans]